MIYDLKRYKTNIDILYFKNKILKNEKKIIQKYPAKSWDLTEDFDGATGLGYNSLTARSPHFNVLNWWGVSSLKKEIKKSYFDINTIDEKVFKNFEQAKNKFNQIVKEGE